MIDQDEDNLRVECAAIRKQDGRVFSIPAPSPHLDVIRSMTFDFDSDNDEFGFLLNDGRFVGRRPAMIVALLAGQIKAAKYPSHGLFTDDLWGPND